MDREAVVQKLQVQFHGLARNQIGISRRACSDAASVETGACESFFGGKPCLPVGFQWPRFTQDNSQPLAFLAQINLAQAAPFDSEKLLPSTGILSFFYELDSMEWNSPAHRRDCFQIFHFPEANLLQPVDFPQDLSEDFRFPAVPVDFTAEKSLPAWEEYADSVKSPIDSDALWDGEEFIYETVKEAMLKNTQDEAPRCKLLGYSDSIQDSMQMECALVAAGYETGNGPVKLNWLEKRRIDKEAIEWVLLFQMESLDSTFFNGAGTEEWPQENKELMFGDCGSLYFFIRRKDLAACRFDRCQMILQCH